MTTPAISIAAPADRDRVVDSLVAAFADDPVLRYLFPDQATYPRYAAAYFEHLFDKRVRYKTIWTIQGASVAIWEPPSVDEGSPPDRLSARLAARLPADAMARVAGYSETVRAALPTTPFWYLGVLGTHPRHAGRQWGRALMRTGLDHAAADGLPAILETSNPVNLAIYRRAGWDVVDTLPEPLTVWVMRQQPPAGARANGRSRSRTVQPEPSDD